MIDLSLGNNIFAKRKENGMTQEDLADRLGVSRQAVSDWERNVKKPETQNLIDLAKLLGASIDWLCADELAGSEALHQEQSVEGEKQPESKPDGRVLKIAPALLEFAKRVGEITADMYISEDKEDKQ